jgi:hypothetical protein
MSHRHALLAPLLALIAVPVFAQTPAPSPYVSVIGTVQSVADHVLTVKTDKTGDTTVKFDDKTSFRKIMPGETDMKKATPATATDVAAGDRIIARVRTENPTGLPATTLYIAKASALADRQQKTLADWQTQGVAGTVKSIDPAAKQLVMTSRGKDVTLDVGGNVSYERYRPDAGKYEEDTFATILAGDQLRVLGVKNADQTQIKVEAIMSGTFKTIPVQIKSIDAATGQIMATDLASKKPILIVLRPETTIKKLDEQTATMMARRMNPTAATGRGGPGGGRAGAGAPEGRGGRGGGGGPMDISKILEQQPVIHLADLKAGEPIVVTGSPAADMSKLTALSLVAGVDPILRAAPANGPDPLGGAWNIGGGEGPPSL